MAVPGAQGALAQRRLYITKAEHYIKLSKNERFITDTKDNAAANNEYLVLNDFLLKKRND